MDGTTNAAKFSLPRDARDIPRPRLFAQIDAARRAPLVWIAGPPGSGKTRLAATYLAGRDVASRWYHLDAGDRDPAAFLEDLAQIAALHEQPPLPTLTPDQAADVPGFCRRYFRRLFACLPVPHVLVFDDWQAAASPALDAMLVAAIDEVPAGASLFVLSRTAPGEGLARHRMNGAVACLDPRELAFAPDEALALGSALGHADPAAILDLRERCEGWAAGLALQLRSRAGRASPSADSRELLWSYYRHEVLDPLPLATRRLLLAAAALPSFTAAMAATLADAVDVVQQLDALHLEGGFLSVQPGDPPRYRFAPLFRELLCDVAAGELAPDEIRRQRQIGSTLLAADGDDAAAFRLCRETGIPDLAIRFVRDRADALLRVGRLDTVRGWLAELGTAAISADPWLSLWQARCDTFAAPREALDAIARSYEAFVDRGDRSGSFHAAVAAVESGLAQLHDLHVLDPWIGVLGAALDAADNDADRLRAWYAFLYAALSRDPGHPRLSEGIEWMRRYARSTRRPDERVACGVILIYYACIAADAVVGQEAIDLAARHAADDAAPPVTRWLWHLWRCLYHLWRIEYPAAATEGEACLAVSRSYGLQALDFMVHVNLAMIDLAEDRFEVVETRLAVLDNAFTGTEHLARALYWLVEVFLRFLRNRHVETREAMTLFLATSRQAGLRCLQILALTDVAALHLIEGNVEDAEALLDEARARVRGTVVRFCDTQIAGLETAIAFGRGQEALARTSLARTLALAETQGTCGCLMWIRSGFSALFSEAWRSGVRPNVIRVLVRRYEVPPPTPFTDPWPWPVRIRAFGAMTIEVDERPLIADGKAQHRVLDLLRLLIAESGRNVSAQRISDALWPDTEGDGAMTNVRGTVKRLRDLLGDADLVRMYDGKVSLNHRMVWLDTWALGELCESVETDAVADATVLEHRLFSLYREPLLAADDHAWLIDGRRRQRERFARCVTTLMRRRADAGDIEHALMLCDRALGIDAQLPDALKRVRDSLLQRLTSHVPTQAIPKGPTRLH